MAISPLREGQRREGDFLSLYTEASSGVMHGQSRVVQKHNGIGSRRSAQRGERTSHRDGKAGSILL